MAGDEIRGCVLPVMVHTYIPGADDSQGNRLRHTLAPLGMTAHITPVPIIPLCPAVPGRESLHLVKIVHIPCLGYELDVSQSGAEDKVLKQGRLVHGRTALVVPHDGGQTEAEPINPVRRNPMAQAVENRLLSNGMIAV